jgi:hypothetical protein
MKPQGTSRAQSVTTGTTTRWLLKSRWHGENNHKCGLGVSPSFSDFSIAGGRSASQLKNLLTPPLSLKNKNLRLGKDAAEP